MESTLLWFVSRATGIVTLTLFSAVMALGILTVRRAGATSALGRAGILRLHRSISLLALAFLVVHITTAILDGYVELDLVDVLVPFVAGYAPVLVGLGTLTVDLAIAVGVTSALRSRMPAKVWKAVHWSAYAMWPIAVIHSFTPGGDTGSGWMLVVLGVNVAAVLAALAYRLQADRHPDTLARTAAELRHAATDTPVGVR